MKKLKINIEGMHCSSCVSNIERSLKKILGVRDVSVSLLLKKGTVECEDSITDEDIKKAVARAGYKTKSIEKE